jgi:BlaI family transcriptional regulator, penicillinase repressor
MRRDFPTPVELEFLKQLWRERRLSARELHECTVDFTRWSFSSTRKTLERMVEKEFISGFDLHGIQVYRARVNKLPMLARLVRDFAGRVLGSSHSAALASFVKSDFLSAREIEELRRMLSEEDSI